MARMGTKVRVQNFQSIEDSEVEISGLTVITGPNNSGKSAIMRAIAGVFTNTPGHQFVRHGTKQSTVTISFDDGNTVMWEKGKGVNKYTVNGKLLERVGHGAPPEVEALGVRPITAGNEPFWPQIGQQVSGQIFLLDRPGSHIAEVIADAERVGACNNALRAVEKDRRSASATLKVRKADVVTATASLEGFNGFDDALTATEALEAAHASATKVRAGIEMVRGLGHRSGTAKAACNRLVGVGDVQVPNTAEKAVKLGRALDKCLQLKADVGAKGATIARLAGSGDIEIPLAADAIEAKRKSNENSHLHTRHKTTQALVAGLAAIAAVDLAPLHDAATATNLSSQTWAQAQALLDRHVTCQVKLDDASVRLKEAEGGLQLLQEQRTDLLTELGHCPTCGSNCAKSNDH